MPDNKSVHDINTTPWYLMSLEEAVQYEKKQIKGIVKELHLCYCRPHHVRVVIIIITAHKKETDQFLRSESSTTTTIANDDDNDDCPSVASQLTQNTPLSTSGSSTTRGNTQPITTRRAANTGADRTRSPHTTTTKGHLTNKVRACQSSSKVITGSGNHMNCVHKTYRGHTTPKASFGSSMPRFSQTPPETPRADKTEKGGGKGKEKGEEEEGRRNVGDIGYFNHIYCAANNDIERCGQTMHVIYTYNMYISSHLFTMDLMIRSSEMSINICHYDEANGQGRNM